MLIAYALDGKTDTTLQVKEFTWEEFAQRMAQPKAGRKDGSYMLRGGMMKEYKRSDENLLEAELLVIDGDSSFDPQTGEVFSAIDPDDPFDKDGVTPKRKGNCTPIDVARDAFDKLGYRYIIHTTHTNTPGILNKWRAFIPVHMVSPEELKAAVEHVISELHAVGCYVETNAESVRWSQPWYLPRCKPQYLDSYKCFASLVGREFDVPGAVSAFKRRAAAAEAATRAQEAPKPKVTAQGPSPIEMFNGAATLATVRYMLEQSGYKFAYKRGDTMRFIAPGSESGTPGVTVFKGAKRGDICAYSHHGAHDPLSGRLNDAFGMFTRLRHNGDQEAAIAEAKAVIGWKQREEPALEWNDQEITAEDFERASTVRQPAAQIKTATFLDLITDQSPDEPDYIEPDFLGPGNFCLIAGPPKAQKSFLLTEMLVAAATGGSFLGGAFNVPKPLKVFYLQAEMNRKLLRKRARMTGGLDETEQRLLGENLIVTERFSMILNEPGVKTAIETIKRTLPGGPDIIAIDPLANLFDGESEDKAPEIMAFLTGRIEAIRRAVNPKAAIVMVHHSGKKSVDDMGRDPFVAIRGSGALRGYYDTGIVIFRKGEDGPERRVHFELRNGDSPEPMTVKLNAMGRFTVIDTTAAGIPRKVALAMLEEINDRWIRGKPLSIKAQSAGAGRYAPLVFARKHEIPADAVRQIIVSWLENEIVEEQMCNSDSKMRGLKKMQNIE